MATEKPFCQQITRWLKHCGHSTAPLTGQDWRAIQAFVHLVELYSVSDGPGRTSALEAMAWTVSAMQPSTRRLAKRTIPMVTDCSDEERIWGFVERLLGEQRCAKRTATRAPSSAPVEAGPAPSTPLDGELLEGCNG